MADRSPNYCSVCRRDLTTEIEAKKMPALEVRFFHKVIHSMTFVEKLAIDPPVSPTKAIAATIAAQMVAQPFAERIDTKAVLKSMTESVSLMALGPESLN